MTTTATPTRLTLHAELAADLMTSNPVSIRADASVREAIDLFTRKGFSAAPVIDAAGRPIGVVSCSDVMIHKHSPTEGGPLPELWTDDSATPVRELMTPGVFSIPLDTPGAQVIQEMLSLKVHRLFVVDVHGVLIGVISALTSSAIFLETTGERHR